MKTATPLLALLLVLSCSSNSSHESKRLRIGRPNKAQPTLPTPIHSGLASKEPTVGFVQPDDTIDPTPVPTVIPTAEPTPEPTPLPPPPPLSVDWNIGGQALATGSGCSSVGERPDTFFISAGNEFSVVMERLGMNLTGTAAPLTERINCSIRVPVRLPKGFFVSRMSHQMSFSVDKSMHSKGTVALQTSLFNAITARDDVALNHGEQYDSALAVLKTAAATGEQAQKSCEATEDTLGIFAANIALTGLREAHDEFIRVAPVDGQTLRLSHGIEIEPCAR
jgi:hypothetical protein